MRSLRLNGEILYRNPYADRDLRLTDEEIAVAQMMEGQKTLCRDRKGSVSAGRGTAGHLSVSDDG